MANIFGVTLKAVKSGIGHDRAGWQGNIYINNKKVGDVLDDGYGGCLDYFVEKSYLEQFDQACNRFKEIQNDFSDTHENFLYALYELSNDEKQFKKYSKKGYTAMVILDYKPRDEKGNIDYSKPFPYPYEESVFLGNLTQVDKILKEKNPVTHKLFKSLEDFCIA